MRYEIIKEMPDSLKNFKVGDIVSSYLPFDFSTEYFKPVIDVYMLRSFLSGDKTVKAPNIDDIKKFFSTISDNDLKDLIQCPRPVDYISRFIDFGIKGVDIIDISLKHELPISQSGILYILKTLSSEKLTEVLYDDMIPMFKEYSGVGNIYDDLVGALNILKDKLLEINEDNLNIIKAHLESKLGNYNINSYNYSKINDIIKFINGGCKTEEVINPAYNGSSDAYKYYRSYAYQRTIPSDRSPGESM